MLAKRRGLLRSCSGRGWTWEEEVTNRTLADMQQGQAWGGGSKQQVIWSHLWDFSEI